MAVKMNNGDENADLLADGTRTPARARWTPVMEQTLIDIIEPLVTQVPDEETKKFVFAKDINWQIVLEAFNEKHPDTPMTATKVHAKWHSITSKVRKQRTVVEILSDLKALRQQRSEQRTSKKLVPDPDLPRKPVTPYFLFLFEKRPRLKEKYPHLGPVDVTRKMSRKWNVLPDEKKEKYILRYKKELEEYNEGMVKYLCHKYPDQKTPMSAYEVWKEKEETAIKSDRPEISQKKLNKKLKRRWENLDASEKKRYWSKSQHAIGRFQKKVLKSSD